MPIPSASLMAVIPGADEGDFAELAAAHQFHRFLKMRGRPLHGPGLHHAIVFARGFHHLRSLFDGGRNRLLDVHVLAGFARFDGHVGVPVIGRGDAHCVNRFVGQNLTEIVNGARLAVRKSIAQLRLRSYTSHTATASTLGWRMASADCRAPFFPCR